MTKLSPWDERPYEVGNLFNPAYCSTLIWLTCKSYDATNANGMPYPLAFISLPILIYSDSAQLIPTSARSKLHLWIQRNPEVLLDFPNRASQIAPYVRESISLGLKHKAFSLSDEGRLMCHKLTKQNQWAREFSETLPIKQATTLGKLFGQEDNITNIFAMFGVRP